MAAPNAIAREVAKLRSRLAEMERRIENMIRVGPVEEVDHDKLKARIKTGQAADGTDQFGPFVPYAQHAGAVKAHVAPSKGQNMVQLSPGGDLEQGGLLPLTWSKANPSPGQGPDPAFTYGDVRIDVGTSEVTITIGGFVARFHGGGLTMTGGRVEHDGKNIGSSHTHGGIERGGSNTNEPNP